jgi:hypothetical protein
VGPAIAVPVGVTLPRWAVYALAILVPVVGIVAFVLGAMFGGPWVGLFRR